MTLFLNIAKSDTEPLSAETPHATNRERLLAPKARKRPRRSNIWRSIGTQRYEPRPPPSPPSAPDSSFISTLPKAARSSAEPSSCDASFVAFFPPPPLPESVCYQKDSTSWSNCQERR